MPASTKTWPLRLSFEERRYGVYVARLPGGAVARAKSLVLAVRSDDGPDIERLSLPAEVTVGPVEEFAFLIHHYLRGISLSALPGLPAPLAGAPGTAYFKLNPWSDVYKALKFSGGVAVRFVRGSPKSMDLWAID